MNKTAQQQRLVPGPAGASCSVAFTAVIPLMTVVNYSVQDIFGHNQFFWVGVDWYHELLDPSTRARRTLLRRAVAQAPVLGVMLVIEIPLGIVVALAMPREGWTRRRSASSLMALPLLIPWNVVGTIWQIFGRADIGLLGWTLNGSGSTTTTSPTRSTPGSPSSSWTSGTGRAWWRCSAMPACKSIPDAYYQAARIDGASRWAVFRYIELPKMRGVLMIAVLLRFMDSFMIYTEPFVVTGGGRATRRPSCRSTSSRSRSASSTSARRRRCRSSTS